MDRVKPKTASSKAAPAQGVLFRAWFHVLGLLTTITMPVAAILVQLMASGQEFSLATVINAQLSQPMIWLVDFFAVLLAIFFLFNIQAESKRIQNVDEISGQLREKSDELSDLREKSKQELNVHFQTEAAISKAKREWEATFDAIADPIIVTDPVGKIIRCNSATIRILEMTYQEIIGMKIEEVFPGIISPPQGGGSVSSQTFLMPLVHGWYDLTGFPIQLSEQQRGIIYIFRDISQRKYAEAELQRQKQYFEAIFQHNPVAVATLDTNGHILACNPGFERLFGYSQIEAIGRKLDDLVTPLELREQALEFSRKVRRGEVVHEVSRRVTKTGDVMEVDIYNVPVSADGENLGVLALFHNITELVQSRRKAEEADLSRSEFLVNVSHEIRTPINGVIGMLNLALDAPVSAEQSEYLATALDSAESLMTLLNDILDLSRIEAGRLELDTTDMNLRTVVENVAVSLAQRADYKGLEFVCMVPPDVPVLLRGDPNRLRQALLNLAGNAVKFTDKGEVVLRVKKVTETDETVTIAFFVQDTGTGVPAERQAAIFDKFNQADKPNTRLYTGSGLGLAISTQLVELMGGKITLISEPNTGSTLSFAVVFQKQETPAAPDAQPETSFQDLRVLVVDPSNNSRMNLTLLLEHLDCRAASAPSPIKAWRLLEEAVRANKPFQVMLIDSRQVFAGADPILQHIRNTPRISSVKILLLNMIGQHITRQDCEAIGCAGYVHKPVRLQSLQAALSEILSPAGFAMPDDPAARRIQVKTAAIRTKRPRRVLLVEDNPVNSKVVLSLLQKFGHLTDLVENGQQAVDAYEKNYYDLILMDIEMPVMDGVEATKKIRALSGGGLIPIIAMTAHVMPGEIERCKECGMEDTLPKPIRPQDLFDKIEYWGEVSAQRSRAGLDTLALPPEDLFQPEPGSTMASGPAFTTGSLDGRDGQSGVNPPDGFGAVAPETWLEINARANPGGRRLLREFRARRTKPLGDPEYIESILPRFGNDLSFFVRMFEDYITQCKEKILDLGLAVQSSDPILVKLLAHNLKGLAANFESVQVATLATELDLQAAQGDLSHARALVEAIEQEIPELEKRLAEIRAFLPAEDEDA